MTTRRLAQSVHIRCEGWRASDDWFHVAPGEGRTVVLAPVHAGLEPPRGSVEALNGTQPAPFPVARMQAPPGENASPA